MTKQSADLGDKQAHTRAADDVLNHTRHLACPLEEGQILLGPRAAPCRTHIVDAQRRGLFVPVYACKRQCHIVTCMISLSTTQSSIMGHSWKSGG
jgi:hypothetical protein